MKSFWWPRGTRVELRSNPGSFPRFGVFSSSAFSGPSARAPGPLGAAVVAFSRVSRPLQAAPLPGSGTVWTRRWSGGREPSIFGVRWPRCARGPPARVLDSPVPRVLWRCQCSASCRWARPRVLASSDGRGADASRYARIRHPFASGRVLRSVGLHASTSSCVPSSKDSPGPTALAWEPPGAALHWPVRRMAERDSAEYVALRSTERLWPFARLFRGLDLCCVLVAAEGGNRPSRPGMGRSRPRGPAARFVAAWPSWALQVRLQAAGQGLSLPPGRGAASACDEGGRCPCSCGHRRGSRCRMVQIPAPRDPWLGVFWFFWRVSSVTRSAAS